MSNSKGNSGSHFNETKNALRGSEEKSFSLCLNGNQSNNFISQGKAKKFSDLAKMKSRTRINFHFNIVELFIITACPCCIWKSLSVKRHLLAKAKEKLFFQLDVLNYLKKMQFLDLLGYSLLEPEENTVLQFLSKPSISLAQRSDIYDRINKINNVNSQEIDEVYSAIKTLSKNKEDNQMRARLYNLTKSEMGLWIKKIQDL